MGAAMKHASAASASFQPMAMTRLAIQRMTETMIETIMYSIVYDGLVNTHTHRMSC